MDDARRRSPHAPNTGETRVPGRLKQLINHALEPQFVLDAAGRTLYQNRVADQLKETGELPKNDLSLKNFVHQLTTSAHLKTINAPQHGGPGCTELKLRFSQPDEGEKLVLLTVSLQYGNQSDQAQFSMMAEMSPIALVGFGHSGRIKFLNRCAEELFGYDRAELIGQPMITLLSDQHRTLCTRLLGRYLRQPEPAAIKPSREFIAVRKDASEFPVKIGLGLVPLSSGPDLLLSLEDQTLWHEQTRKLMAAKAAADSANQAKSNFLANMTHEIRTPLNAIVGYSQLIDLSGEVSPQGRENLHSLQAASSHLLELINNVLDLSKIEAGHQELKLAPTRIDVLLKKVTSMFALQCATKGLNWSLDAADCDDCLVQADSGKLGQVLANLLANAVKFTADGGVSLHVRRDAAHYSFSIRDTGPGVPKNLQELVKSPFYQVESATPGSIGTGLGLSITVSLLQLMGSELEIQSEPGNGSEFSFALQLPPTKGPTSADPAPIRDRGAHPRWQFGERDLEVLIVDDIWDNRDILKQILRPTGARIREATSGQAALDAVSKAPPDLILMDIRMPSMSGCECLSRLRSSEDFAHIPIIAVTASNLLHGREHYLQLGFDEFISKPFEVSELHQIIWATLHPLGLIERRDETPEGAQDSTVQTAPATMQPAMAHREARGLQSLPEASRTALLLAADKHAFYEIQKVLESLPSDVPDDLRRHLMELNQAFDFSAIKNLCEQPTGG